MITIKSNIEFLTNYVNTRRGVEGSDKYISGIETNRHLDYAIESLIQMQSIIDDANTSEVQRG